MKKIIFVLLMCFMSLGISAQTYKYRATSMSYRYVNGYGNWTNWSDWQSTNILIVISIDRDKISIYSKELQEYDIYSSSKWEPDYQGGQTATLKAVNEEGRRCDVRLRSLNSGELQVYVDFADAMWVYNVYMKN